MKPTRNSLAYTRNENPNFRVMATLKSLLHCAMKLALLYTKLIKLSVFCNSHVDGKMSSYYHMTNVSGIFSSLPRDIFVN